MKRSLLLLPVVFFVLAQSIAAQESHRAFDVASVRPSSINRSGAEGSKRSRIEYSPLSLSMWNVDLVACIQWAYGVRDYQISGPGFPESGRYDIVAKIGSPASQSEMRMMLQDLLGKRFELKIHRESRMLPVYGLVVAKGGPKLPAPKPDASPTHSSESLPRIENDSFVFYDASMAEFAAKLSLLRGIERPVVDRTGIPGIYDVTLKSAPSAILQPDGPSLFTLVEEQLGLKLVPEKSPIEVLVVDHVAKPSAN